MSTWVGALLAAFVAGYVFADWTRWRRPWESGIMVRDRRLARDKVFMGALRRLVALTYEHQRGGRDAEANH